MAKQIDELQQEVDKRRTFAIISHPDAGKTTLTEKLLLFWGAIRLAGSVKARKASKHATSDWMEIEKQRGISVTSSVMQFDYLGHRINILDTPGHQDFSEDTYRTLTAADSAVMLIDVAKGVEAQTIKLFQVCAKRGIPIFTFINKLDREGRSPFDLMEELEQVLGIRSVPMNWPIGSGRDLCGVYDRVKIRLNCSRATTIPRLRYRRSKVMRIRSFARWQAITCMISYVKTSSCWMLPETNLIWKSYAGSANACILRQCDQQFRRPDLPGELSSACAEAGAAPQYGGCGGTHR